MEQQVDALEKTYTGWYGIVVLLDEKLTDGAFELARRFTLSGKFSVKFPHLSLYHATLKNVPTHVIQERLKNVHELLRQMQLTFKHIAGYHDYLFWELDRLSQDLRDAHKETLKLVAYHPRGEAGKGVEMPRALKAEDRNIWDFGHALVAELYRPHITLGATPGGFPYTDDLEHEVSGGIAKVCFCEMEPPWGSIKRIVLSK